MRTRIGGRLGVPCLPGFLVTRLVGSAAGLVILFSVSTWLVRALRQAAVGGVRATVPG